MTRDRSISPTALIEQIDRGDAPAILDVRSREEFAAGHVPGAVNVPFETLIAQAGAVRAQMSDPLVVYCGHGPRAWLAGRALRWRGFTRIGYLRGHMAGWRRAGLREER